MTRYILGIESSCDDTSAAVVTDDLRILSNARMGQDKVHAQYGGVVPELAGRAHLSNILPIVRQALDEAGIEGPDLTAIAVTRGPGLIGSLLVGLSTAKALSMAWGVPLYAVDHLYGHLASARFADPTVEYPALALLVSGGHTLLAAVDGPTEVTVLGGTRDDSAGETYDKVARMMGLGFPGGPIIDRMAKDGADCLGFPRPMKNASYEFSFSGLKTAVAVYLKGHPDAVPADVAASFAAAVMDVLVHKIEYALAQGRYRSVAVVGGVSASPILRRRLAGLAERTGVRLCLPPLRVCTDNGAMIAAQAWGRLEAGEPPSDLSVGAYTRAKWARVNRGKPPRKAS